MNRPMLTAIAAAIAMPAAAIAHHGWTGYDAQKTLQVTAPLSDLSWTNPHGTAKIAYEGKEWAVVLAPITRMEARGLSKEMLGPKQKVTLVGYPRLDGSPEMRIERVIVGDKTVELR